MTTNTARTTSELEEIEDKRQTGMIVKGRDRYYRSEKKNQEKGRNSVTPPFIYVQKQLLVPLAEGIDKFIKHEYKNAGRRHTGAEPLRDLDDPKKIALVSLKIIIDCIASNKTENFRRFFKKT